MVLATETKTSVPVAQVFWDVPLFAEHQEVRDNKVDPRIIHHLSKRVITLEISCPWVKNQEKKKEEIQTGMKVPNTEVLQRRTNNNQGYKVKHYNNITDVFREMVTRLRRPVERIGRK